MKVVLVHQHYRIRGGEDAMVEATASLLARHGVEVRLVTRDSGKITNFSSRVKSFFSGIYSFGSAKAMRELIACEHPDIIHVHNLHPGFSPSVIRAARRAGVPVVMTCHNYRLACPGGMLMCRSEVCERCLGGREFWCLLKNCKGDLFWSFGYALRNTLHRWLGFYRHGVCRYIAVSTFMREKLIATGIPEKRISVIPNFVSNVECGMQNAEGEEAAGGYVGFAGRFTPQKGIETLLKAARLAGVPVLMAGDPSPMPEAVRDAPDCVHFAGPRNPTEMADFYHHARAVVVPSECLEPFGLVAAEAMIHARPVIASRIGGLAEIVQDGVTGLLVPPGDASALASAIRRLWDDPELCHELGKAGRARAHTEYLENRYFERLMQVYESEIQGMGSMEPMRPMGPIIGRSKSANPHSVHHSSFSIQHSLPHIILTLDYELPGGGLGDVRRQMIEPTRRLLDLCEAHGARLTIMAELGELWAFEDPANAPFAAALGYDPATEIRAQLAEAIARGHDVQLHLHSQWLGAKWDGAWQLDYSRYRLTDLSDDEAVDCLCRAKSDLETLLRPHAPDYTCVGFRAGHWNAFPPERYLAILARAGLRSDTSVFKWGWRQTAATGFDYRAAFSNVRAWFADPADINDRAPEASDDAILEVPIATNLCSPLALFSWPRLRLGWTVLREHHRIESSARGAGRTAAGNSSPFSKLKKLITRRPLKLDFCKLSARQMLAMTERLLEQEAQHGEDDLPMPIVMIGHSKQAGEGRELDRFLKLIIDRHGDRLIFSNYRDFVGNYMNITARTSDKFDYDYDYKHEKRARLGVPM